MWLLRTCGENRCSVVRCSVAERSQRAGHCCRTPLTRVVCGLGSPTATASSVLQAASNPPTDAPKTPSHDVLRKGAQPASGFRSGRPILADFGGSPTFGGSAAATTSQDAHEGVGQLPSTVRRRRPTAAALRKEAVARRQPPSNREHPIPGSRHDVPQFAHRKRDRRRADDAAPRNFS